MKLSLISIILFPVAVFGQVGDSQMCGSTERQSPIYQSFKTCQDKLAKSDLKNAFTSMSIMTHSGVCKEDDRNATAALSSICGDPAGYSCANQDALNFNSHCEMQMDSDAAAALNPAYVEYNCNQKAAVAAFYDQHRSKCKPTETEASCESLLSMMYADQIASLQRGLAYTPERVDRMKKIFARVKQKELDLVQNSNTIPPAKKKILLDRLNATKLDLPPGPDSDSCTLPGPDGPETSLFNQRSETAPKIELCLGAVVLLDQQNDYDVMLRMGHELSHSIDPCNLEIESGLNGRAIYPGLTECIHGGKGVGGCEGAILNCNKKRGELELCQSKSSKPATIKECVDSMKKAPSCPWGPEDPVYEAEANDNSKYRNGKDPIDQTEESFADFIGAEVTGQLMQEDQAASSPRSKADALVAISADMVQMHGGCLAKNTNDSHPTGSLRINRVMMGSKSFREAMCGPNAKPPQTAGAGMTCSEL